MDHRDRGRGELARHERQENAGWADPFTGPPGSPYSRPEGSYRTPSRRRARHRGAPDPVDTYTPSWAVGDPEPAAPTEPADSWRADSSGRAGNYRSDSSWRADGSRADDDAWRAGDSWRSDTDGSGRAGGRHHRTDPAFESGAGRRRGPAEPAESAGDVAAGWHDRDSTGANPRRRERTADGWRDSSTAADSWRAGTSADNWRDDTAPPDGGSLGAGRRRADRHTDNLDSWRRGAGTWRDAPPDGGAPPAGRHSDNTAPPTGRHPGDNTDSWRRAETDGSGATGGSFDDRPRRTGRRRRSDPEETPSGTSAVAGGEPIGWTDPARWRAGDEGTAAGHDRPAAGERRGWPGSPEPESEAARRVSPTSPAARWIRSPDEAGSDADRSRGSDPGPITGGRRRRAASDAEPVRGQRAPGSAGRHGDPDPVRRPGVDRGRHADSDSARHHTAPSQRDGEAEGAPWDRFSDTGTGFLGRVVDDAGGGRRRAPERDGGDSSGFAARSRRAGRAGGDRGGLSPTSGGAVPTSGGAVPTSGGAVPTSGGGWGRRGETARWDGFTDTGQWDRFTDTTEWRRDELVGPGRDGDPRQVAGTDQEDTFWSGTRLAEDDPRWMGIPDSAPSSPAVAYPPRRRPAPSGREPAEQVRVPRQRTAAEGWAGGRTDSSAGVRRPVAPVRGPGGRSSAAGRRLISEAARRRAAPLSRRLEDDLLDPRPAGPLSAVLYTAAWYAVPVLAMLVWVLTLDVSLPVGCVPELAGSCESERGRAVTALVDGLPRFGAALATSLVIAALLRWVNKTWRVVTIGLSAAVVGGGLSTLLFSVISDQRLT